LPPKAIAPGQLWLRSGVDQSELYPAELCAGIAGSWPRIGVVMS
jgi:hypothetical protein